MKSATHFKQGNERKPATATVINFPDTPRKRLKAIRNIETERLHAAIDLVKKHGFMSVNDDERQLIELLRWTSHAGRDAVKAFARQMNAKSPWVRGGHK